MTILGLIVFIIVVGVLLGALNALIPMAGQIKTLLNFLVVILLLVYILQFFAILPAMLPVPRIFMF